VGSGQLPFASRGHACCAEILVLPFDIISYSMPTQAPDLSQSSEHDAALARRISSTRVAWRPPAELDHATWIVAGRRLGSVGRLSNWWVGDWLIYGAAKWGKKYVLAAKITGYDVHSLENMVYVASRFPASLRRENLSWSHHFLVAALEPEHRSYWLDFATEHRLSVNDLRIELRSSRRATRQISGNREPPLSVRASHGPTHCPSCGASLSDADAARCTTVASSRAQL
jgi:hypothetical protein